MKKQNIRFGILSTAKISKKVCLAIQSLENAVVAAVASRDLEKAQVFAKLIGIPTAYGSYQELIDDESIHAVYIPLPTGLKKEWAIKCALKRKSVLLEKPLPGLDTSEDIEEIVRVCQENKVQFIDGTMWFHSYRTKEVLRLKGQIGPVRIVNSACTFRVSDPGWLEGKDIRTDKALEPLGCLGDVGWYCVSATLFALDFQMPRSVLCTSHILNSQGVPLQLTGFLEFEETIARFDCSFLVPSRTFLEIVGAEGVIRLDDFVGGIGRTGNDAAYFEDHSGSNYFFVDDVQGKEELKQCEASNHAAMMAQELVRLIESQDGSYEWAQRSVKIQRVLGFLYQSLLQGNKRVEIK